MEVRPSTVLWFFCFSIFFAGCERSGPPASKASASLASASTPQKRFYALSDAAKNSLEEGKVEEARKYADELLAMAPAFSQDWNYGNAIHNGNVVLGRIALKEGKLEEARQHLLKAGASPGSPQMNSFGPNMTLAKDLLEKGERDTVLKYFELCRAFWKMGASQLNLWTEDVKAGKVPDFGPNLLY